MLSNQGGDEEDEREEGGDVGLVEHGADDGHGGLVGGDVLGNCLAAETEHDQEGDQEVLHLIFMIYQIKSYPFKLSWQLPPPPRPGPRQTPPI